MPQAPLTRRRSFQFGMGTLLVLVTVLAVPLGFVAYQLNWIRQRHEAIATRLWCGSNLTPECLSDLDRVPNTRRSRNQPSLPGLCGYSAKAGRTQ